LFTGKGGGRASGWVDFDGPLALFFDLQHGGQKNLVNS
jgi:hypothetical protein